MGYRRGRGGVDEGVEVVFMMNGDRWLEVFLRVCGNFLCLLVNFSFYIYIYKRS